jgi:hypothetical protein
VIQAMRKKLKFSLISLASASAMVLALQSSALANPFRFINDIVDTINNANRSVDSLNRAINNTSDTINNLTNTLGINPNNLDSSVSDADSTGQVLLVYDAWYSELSTSDQEIVSWLVMEHARNPAVSFETIASSEWFWQQSVEEQSQVAAMYFKLDEIIKATQNEKGRFLAYAFCVNGGAESCDP